MEKKKISHRGASVLACVALVGSIVVTGGAVHAAEPDTVSAEEAGTAISSVQESSPDLVLDSDLTPSGDSFVHQEEDGSVITVPRDAADGIVLETSLGADVSITVPEATVVDSAVIDASDLVTYPGTTSYNTSVSVSEGGAQFLTTIADSAAPREYTYDLMLPEGATLQVDEESGGAIARTSEGELLLLIAPPWAVDAAGKAIDTHFKVQGHSLTQIIEHQNTSVTYPVVADPTVNSKLIKRYDWHRYRSGWAISVAVTPTMGWALDFVADADGWSQLKNAVRKNSTTEYNRLNTTSMRQQWTCHALQKAVIGVGTWFGWDGNPTWDLETTRPAIKGNVFTVSNFSVYNQCNW